MTPLIEIENLSVGFFRKEVLANVSFKVREGSVCVFLGPNGAGKSTLLRTLVGLMKPLSGAVRLSSKDAHTISEKERAHLIAWIPQDESTEFGWLAEEYVALGRVAKNQSLLETATDREMVQVAMEQTSSLDLVGHSITEMSGGERQRVRLARAIAQETPILALDEPSTHLDIHHQLELLSLLARFKSQGKTILVSMHDINQALQIGDQFVVVHSHEVHVFASATDLLKSKMLETAFGVRFRQIENGVLVVEPLSSITS